jgi:hypothetical protein
VGTWGPDSSPPPPQRDFGHCRKWGAVAWGLIALFVVGPLLDYGLSIFPFLFSLFFFFSVDGLRVVCTYMLLVYMYVIGMYVYGYCTVWGLIALFA